MDPRAALELIRTAVTAGRFRLSYHAAQESLPERGLLPADVQHALERGFTALSEDDLGMKWKVYGTLPDGEEYAIIVRLRDDEVLVITAHPPP